MAAAAASPPSPPKVEPSAPGDFLLPRPSVAITWDSEALRSHAEILEMESKAIITDPARLPALENLLLETYAKLRPQPVDYEHRQIMVDVFNKIAEEIFGKENGFPVVEAFGSFTMDLFTPKSDLDLSLNFNTDVTDQFPRKEKISAIMRLARNLRAHQNFSEVRFDKMSGDMLGDLGNGRCYGVLPIVTARVPVLKVTDQGTGVECDISVENKDGMSRSMIFKFISSIDARFGMLCYLMKSWAKAHDVNCPRDRTMSSMAIISLVAFHLQTRRPPILPAFSAILKDGSDFASIERNILLFEGFGSRNKESIAELFVSLMNKLVAVEGLWEQGLCASNFEGSWISKTWERGVGDLSVEDFLDRSQNFARSVGNLEMKKICEFLRVTVSHLAEFLRGEIDALKLKALLFEPLKKDRPVTVAIQKVKWKRLIPNKQITKSGKRNRKRKNLDQDKPTISMGQNDAKKKKVDSVTSSGQKDVKEKVDEVMPVTSPGQKDAKKKIVRGKPVTSPGQKDVKKIVQGKPVTSGQKDSEKKVDQDKPVTSPGQKDAKKKVDQDKLVTPCQKDSKNKVDQDNKSVTSPDQKDAKKKSNLGHASGNSQGQQKKAAHVPVSGSRPPTVFIPQMHRPVPTQPSAQFAHIPQNMIAAASLAYGHPQAHLHPAYHPHQGLVGQPQGNLMHLNHWIPLQHQGQAMFPPPAVHHPAVNGFHPYGFSGAQQMQYNDHRFVQRAPYGMGPNFWR
ncbi:hypothetical protein ACP70R_015968 [Stipagrostis hirtigluma subsp. patula]